MAIITMWCRPSRRCVWTVNHRTSMLQLIGDRRVVVRQQPIEGAEEARAVARQWEAEQQAIAKLEAALEALAIERPALDITAVR
jgi:hypothetical protein